MLALALTLLSTPVTTCAAQLECHAKCVVLQTGPTAEKEIAQTDRPYENTRTRVVKGVRPVAGYSIEEARATCEEFARTVSWWRPPGDLIQARLAKRIKIDERDDVRAVEYFDELENCAMVPPEYEFGQQFIPNFEEIEKENQ